MWRNGTMLLLVRATALVLVCAGIGASAGEVPVRVVSTRTETVTLNTPDNYNGSDALPLAVMLHGLGQSGPATSRRWNVKKAGNDLNMMWVAPTGQGRRWCGAGCCGCSSDRDSKFLRALVEAVIAEPGVNVDMSRIFFYGISNGGFMSYRMACEHADLIAGIMPVCGANYRNFERSCKPSEPVNILHIHGTRDAVIRYSTAEPSVRGWAGKQCTGGVENSSEYTVRPENHHWGTDLPRAQVKRWTGCEADVELWTAPGVGHCPQASWANMNWLLDRPKRGRTAGGGSGGANDAAREAPSPSPSPVVDEAFLWELIRFLQTAPDALDPVMTAKFLAWLDDVFDTPPPPPPPPPPRYQWSTTGMSPESIESLQRLSNRSSSGSSSLNEYLARLRSGRSTLTLSEFDQSTVFAKNPKCAFPFEHEGVSHDACVLVGDTERCKNANGEWKLCYALDEDLFGEDPDANPETDAYFDASESMEEFDLGAILLADIAHDGDDDDDAATAAAAVPSPSSLVTAQSVRVQSDGSACVFPADFQGEVYYDCVDYADAEWCVNAQNEWAECVPV